MRSRYDHSWRGQIVALMDSGDGKQMAQVMWTNPLQHMGLCRPEDLEVVPWLSSSRSVS